MREPGQPRERSTVATAPAVWHRRSPRSRSPNLSVRRPRTALACRGAYRATARRPDARRPRRARRTAGTPRRDCRGNYYQCAGRSALAVRAAGRPCGRSTRRDIAGLQHGQGAARRRRRAPSRPRYASAFSCGRPWRDVSGPRSCASRPMARRDPRVRVVEARRGLDEIKHGVLHAGAGREHVGCLVLRIASDRWTIMPGIFACAGCRDAGTVIDDYRTRPVDQPVPLRRRLVAKHCIGPGAEQRGPEHSPGQGPREGGVDASLKPLPSAVAALRSASCAPQSRVCALTAGDGLPWVGQQLADGEGSSADTKAMLPDQCTHRETNDHSLWITPTTGVHPVDNPVKLSSAPGNSERDRV